MGLSTETMSVRPRVCRRGGTSPPQRSDLYWIPTRAAGLKVRPRPPVLAVVGVLGMLGPDRQLIRGRVADHRSGPANGHVVALAGLLTTEVSGPKMLG